jgi:RNA 3'-terminal phosphate cyclase (ATP)
VIHLDGSQGEGGGQILRTALALSLCTGQAFRIANIRAGRQKPGLLRQHLTSVNAAAEIGAATVDGARLGSSELVFRPATLRPGTHRFAVGTAGSAMLVLQTILPALLMADSESIVTCQGGTHNPFAPTFDFIDRCFATQLRRMGANVDLHLRTAGFFPAGGGEFTARITSSPRKLAPISITEKGPLASRAATIIIANLSDDIAQRELAVLKENLAWPEDAFTIRRLENSPGPGNIIQIEEQHEHITEITTAFGEKGLAAESVASAAIDAHRRHLRTDAVVGEHLADQLLLPMALAGVGTFVLGKPTRHTLTNAETIQKFLPTKIHFRKDDSSPRWTCEIE